MQIRRVSLSKAVFLKETPSEDLLETPQIHCLTGKIKVDLKSWTPVSIHPWTVMPQKLCHILQILNLSSQEREISHPNLSPHLHWVGSRAPWIRDSKPSCYFWPLLLPEDFLVLSESPTVQGRNKSVSLSLTSSSVSSFKISISCSRMQHGNGNCLSVSDFSSLQVLAINTVPVNLIFVLMICPFVQETQNTLIWIHTEITGSPILIP